MNSWVNETIAIIDTETTGLDPKQDAIIEIAVLFVTDLEVVGSYSTLINPGVPIPPEITAITGISDQDVKYQPHIEHIERHIMQLLDGAMYHAFYNARFDVPFLANALRFSGLLDSGWKGSILDPLIWVREFDRYTKGPGRHKLVTTCERYGLTVRSDAHMALVDCHMALDVMRHLADKVPQSMADLIEWQDGLDERQRKEYERWKLNLH